MQENTDRTTMIAMGVVWSIVTVSLMSESYGGLPPINEAKNLIKPHSIKQYHLNYSTAANFMISCKTRVGILRL